MHKYQIIVNDRQTQRQVIQTIETISFNEEVNHRFTVITSQTNHWYLQSLLTKIIDLKENNKSALLSVAEK